MKKQIKLLTCLTKPLVLFLLLFALGVGQMWGTARTFKSGQEIFFKDASGNITWGDLKCLWKVSSGDIFAYFWNDSEEAWSSSASLASGEINKENAIYKITVPGSGKEFTKVVFTRHPNGVTPTWNNRWNQTTDQYPEESYNMFCISNDGDYDGSRNPTHKWKGTWDRYSTGALCGDFNNWDPDRGKFTSGRVILELEASTAYGFKVLKGDGTVLDNWYGLNSGNITNTTSSWWQLKSKENNCTVTTGEAGEYCFHWDGSSYLGIYYPQARFSASQYIYFNVEGETGWKSLGDKVMFWTKYYDSGGNNPDGGLSCNTPVETYVYYAQIPNHDYIGQVQLNRYDGNTWKASSAVAYAYNRTSSSQNCMIEESGKESASGDGDWTPQWTTYCPPTTSETFTDNSTETISWQPNTNDGSTSANAIWVKTGTTLKVAATASKAVADDNMTIKYDFKVNSTSQQDGTTATYTHSASTNNTTYELSADIYTNYKLDNTKNSTKHTQSSIFYKALDTYSVTHTLSGVTKASGREDADAAAYYVAYDATYTADAGYYLPSDITVTIGGVTKTKDTDYTWTVTDGTSGTLNILSSKIDGNVVVTINGVYRWSVAGSWKVITPGEGDPYWDADTYAMGTITQVSSDYVCSVTVTLDANTNYTFKIVDRAASPYEYWGNNTTTYYINYSTDMSSGWTFGNNSSNTAACGLTAAGAGTYTFTWNITQSKLKVTFPTSYYVTAAGNPAAGGTVTPSSATYMSTSVGGEITATPNYSHYFNGWTSNAGGTFTDNTAATTTFKPASADATVTAAFPERTAFIEGNFQVYNSTRATRTKTGDSWVDDATTIKMTYDSENNRYYLHTYSTPAELAEQLNSTNAYFYVKTSTSGSSIADAATYKAYSSSSQSLSEYGYSHALVTVSSSEHGFKFTGSEDGYVILYFNGTHVWYELECALSYYGGEGATGDAPASRTYYAYGSNQTAASNTYSKTGYTFDHWDTAADDSGSDYAAGATNVAMNAHEVCLHAQWTAKEYTINLANMEATTAGTESVTVTFDASTHMTASDPITKPTKTHYDFGGYWTSENTGATLDHMLIGADGKWIADVEGYTSNDGAGNPTWVHDYPISLYAKWTEHEYAVTLAISPDGTGTTSPSSSTTAKYVTASGDITATPSTGYSFREWDFSKTDAVPDIYCAGGYSSTSNPVRIHAVHDGTLTANFTANGYTVTLENNDADEGHKGTENVSVTYNVTTGLTDAITKPEKSHYDFGGYYTSDDEGETLGTQLIDENGNWKKGISGYTGTSGDDATWVYAGNITLYAKWTETAYTITPSVNLAGAGSVNTVTDAHLVTPSSDITATPTNAVWVFDHWTCGTNVGIAGDKGTTDNPVTVTASQNSTITAYFKHRYNLLGSKYENDKEKASMATGGMPGWTYGSGADFTINSYTADGDNATVDLSYTCTLEAGTYIFEIHDRQKGESLGRKGDGGGVYALTDGSSVQLRGGTDKDQSIFFYPQHAGQYTFRITYMTKDGNYYYPTVTIERPHQLHFGTGYAGIDNLSSVTSGTTGGTLAVTTSAGSLSNEDWVTYGTDVTYTPSAATGYTFEGFYSSNEYSDRFTQDNPWVHYNVTGDDNVYAKFVETSTSVTLANDGNGHVTIGGNTETSTTCGVTTTRELTAVPNDGYMFSSWDKSGDDITLSSTSTNPTTLRGQGAGATSGQTATANFTYRWALKAESDNWGSSEFIIGNISTDDVSGDVIGYVEISLAANTNYQFTMKDLLTNDIYKNNNTEVQYMTYSNHTDWGFATDMTYNCGITTAGRGTYRFTWNITDTTMTVTYPTSYLVNLGVKSVTYEGVEGSLGTVTATDASSNTYSNGLYIANGETVTITATPADDYDFVGWWNSSDYSGKCFATANPTSWTVGAAVYAYAKFTEKSNTFSAASGSNWSTTANWSAGHVPTIHEVAVINKPVTVDIAHAVANRIVLDQNSHTGKLTVQANKGLEVAGTITRTTDGSNRLATREEDLVLESSSAGNASLIFNNSNSCAATVQMYSKATIVGNTWNWQYVGTPFTGSIPQYNYYGSWMYKWNGGWEVVHGGDELTPFAGYCLTQNSATTHVMGGTLVPTTSKSVTMAASTDMVLANSWTAPIWIDGFTASTFTSEPATIYLFNTGSAENGSNEYVSGDEAGTYVTVPVHAAEYTGNEFIAPMQGFFVTTNGVGGSSGTITMNYNDLVRPSGVHTGIVAGPMKVRKQEDMKPEVMKIRANGTQYSDRVVILAREDFSEGFDNGWDGEKLSFGAEAPSVYVINEQGGYDAVSAIPGFEGTLVGFRAGTNNSCTMTFEYDGEEIWYLNDLQTQQSTLIDSELTYTFSTSSYDNEARFIISATPIRKITTGNESVGAEAAKVRKLIINDKLYIIRGGRMYSADGAMIK